ncbi:MAG TPA: EamA family transporter [Ktedonobacterales bacterium]|nr:EamA family transporter [Ktedonobacterales bacterium]
MGAGIFFGLAAALCWGVADFCARYAARSGGTLRTLLWMQMVGAAGLLAVGLPLGLVRLNGLPLGTALAAMALGLVILVGAGLLYRAFAIGTLAVVSPIAASYAAVAALLALLISHEAPRPTQLAGIGLTLMGAVLTSSVRRRKDSARRSPLQSSRSVTVDGERDLQGGHRGHREDAEAERGESGGSGESERCQTEAPEQRRPGRRGGEASASGLSRHKRLAPGVPEAVGATLIFGVAYWALRFVTPVLGGATSALLAKIADLVAMAMVTVGLALLGRGSWLCGARAPVPSRSAVSMAPAPPEGPGGPLTSAFFGWVVALGLLDTAANTFYNVGVTQALTSIVAILSSLFSAVTVLLAWIFLHERLARWQWAGVAAILAGVALVSV